tara:strand:+ start:116 stop:328 length:213 start_codon:yes stop_codon:yes gene_type:complete
MIEENGWKEYKEFVIQELKRSNDRLEKIDDRLINIERELAVLKTKMYIGSAFIAVVFSGIITLMVDASKL